MWTSSALSISSSMPVILPARSGNMRWMRGKSLSPNICFCSCGGAAASILAVKGSWPWTSTACCGGGAPPGATICPGIAWAGHHGHWLGSRLVHRSRLLLPNSGSSHPWSAGSNPSSHTHSSHAHAWHTAGPWHCLLLWPAGLGTDLGGSEESLGLGHCGHEVASHAHLLHAAHLLHPHARHPLDVLRGKVSLPVLLSLGEGNIEGLCNDDPSIHLCDGLGCLLGGRETNESEALAPAFFVHDLGAGDRPVGGKLLPQPLVIDGVVKVLDVEVDALVSVQPLQLQLLELLLQLLLALSLLLGSADVQSLAKHLHSVELVHCFLCGLAVFEGDKSEAFVLSVRPRLHDVLTLLALDIPILHHFV